MSNKHEQYQFPGQHEGEVVNMVFRQHPLVMRKQLILGLLLILVAVLPLDFPQIYSVAGLPNILALIVLATIGFALLFWFYRWVGWYYSIYILTDQRLVEIRQKGFFNRSVEEWQLNKIYNVNYSVRGFQAFIFGYGDVVAQTIIGEFLMPSVKRPIDVHRRIMEAVREAGGAQGMPFDNTPPLV